MSMRFELQKEAGQNGQIYAQAQHALIARANS